MLLMFCECYTENTTLSPNHINSGKGTIKMTNFFELFFFFFFFSHTDFFIWSFYTTKGFEVAVQLTF